MSHSPEYRPIPTDPSSYEDENGDVLPMPNIEESAPASEALSERQQESLSDQLIGAIERAITERDRLKMHPEKHPLNIELGGRKYRSVGQLIAHYLAHRLITQEEGMALLDRYTLPEETPTSGNTAINLGRYVVNERPADHAELAAGSYRD